VQSLSQRDQRREVELFFEEFGSSSIDFVIRFWVDYRRQRDYLSPRSEAIMAIKKAFDDHGITIPFPIRTLDFGVVGGERLSEDLRRLVAEAGDRRRGGGEDRS
jgi:small conductance mechanosensitive channel